MIFTMQPLNSISPAEHAWEIIASYANRDVDWPKAWQKWQCFWQFQNTYAASERTALVLLGFTNEPKKPFRKAVADLEREREDFVRMLRWLCAEVRSGKPSVRPDVPKAIFGFLRTHAVNEFRQKLTTPGGGYLPLRSGCDNAIGLLCRFVIERAGEKSPGEIPLRICRRNGCGRFFVARRDSAAFCSASCRAQNFWTAEKKADYMRQYRKILKQRKNQERKKRDGKESSKEETAEERIGKDQA